MIFSAVDYLDDAVELALGAPWVRRLVVFDLLSRVDAHREGRRRETAPSGRGQPDQCGDAGRAHRQRSRGTCGAAARVPGPDPLSLLIYTSGSTGAPKGAMYTERLVANAWRPSNRMNWGERGSHPSITLNFMPMSHVMGRMLLYGTLGSGGTAYFAARSDLSTFLEDLALVRPTQLSFVPRIWDTIVAEVTKELDRRPGEREAVFAELRHRMLGGRYLWR